MEAMKERRKVFRTKKKVLATTYFPTSVLAVSLALEVLTSEFGMGIGCVPSALVTRTRYVEKQVKEESKDSRSISTGQLNTLLHLHFRPIYQVVFLGS